MSNVIETHNLTKYYGPKCVVDSLDLRVPQGSVYGLLGRNGAGKSTIIKMLLGMVHPSYGRAELFGEDVGQLRPETRARIAYLAEGHPLYRWMTIGDAVRFTRSFYPQWNDKLLEQILDHFELSPRAKIRRLSNGQRAQVSLALAVAPEPELLILDDPTLGLDTVVRRDFLESLIQIIQRRGGRSCSAPTSWATWSGWPTGSASWWTACCGSTARPSISRSRSARSCSEFDGRRRPSSRLPRAGQQPTGRQPSSNWSWSATATSISRLAESL